MKGNNIAIICYVLLSYRVSQTRTPGWRTHFSQHTGINFYYFLCSEPSLLIEFVHLADLL